MDVPELRLTYGEVGQWYNAQNGKVQAAFDQRLRHLQQMQSYEWRKPYTKQLSGGCDGLVEIRFNADRVQHRPLGFYGPSRLEFTILLCAIERGGRFEPRDACNIALRRKDEVNNHSQASRIYNVE